MEPAAAGVALAGVGAQQMARRLAGIFGQQFKIRSGGKPLAALPFVDGGDGKAQVGGNLFQRNSLLAPPFPEGVGKALTNITFKSRFPKHGGISPQATAG